MDRAEIPRFNREFLDSPDSFTAIGDGDGAPGGKASGLFFIRDVLRERFEAHRFPAFEVTVPRLIVLTTDRFDRFIEHNDLADIAHSDTPDDRIAHAFLRADLPPEMVGDLRALVQEVHQPLAVRSSSLLEDAMYEPFAGVYGTKMIPNNQHDPNARFRGLVDAIKFVYASTFFEAARLYRARTSRPGEDKMAVVIQEVVGRRHGDRFYPDISGVARSHNFYATAPAKPAEGVVTLALGLGKTIVDGGVAWTYSPAHPRLPPPFGSVRELLNATQTGFWAVNMGQAREYNPMTETEHLVLGGLPEAEADGTLRYLASTYDPRSDRLVPGTGARGPRVLTFAPLLVLNELPLNDVIVEVLEIASAAVGGMVEIELAATIDPKASPPVRLGFLQVRPMVVNDGLVDLSPEEMDSDRALVASSRVLGNGADDSVRDIVYVRPDLFETRFTRAIAAEISAFNRELAADRTPYALIGFGRWGSADPWLGIPVAWSAISGARAIVEAAIPALNAEPSQASHFFHNVSSFGVAYFSVPTDGRLDWEWLDAQPAVRETVYVRHVRLDAPVEIKVDGRQGRGVMLKPLPR